MFKHLNFPILVINPAIGLHNVAGTQLDALFKALDGEGFEVLGAESLDEGRLIAEAHRVAYHGAQHAPVDSARTAGTTT